MALNAGASGVRQGRLHAPPALGTQPARKPDSSHRRSSAAPLPRPKFRSRRIGGPTPGVPADSCYGWSPSSLLPLWASFDDLVGECGRCWRQIAHHCDVCRAFVQHRLEVYQSGKGKRSFNVCSAILIFRMPASESLAPAGTIPNGRCDDHAGGCGILATVWHRISSP
jgi:hypothetical protein